MDWRETWTYDEDGNVLTHEVDGDGDGTVDLRETWNFRDVDICGSSTYEAGPLGEAYAANQAGVDEDGVPILLAGNTAEAMFVHSESEVGPLFFDIRHHMDDVDGRRFDSPIPDVVGCETAESPEACLDAYGNHAQIRSSRSAFEQLNPDVDPVPHDVYFPGN